MTREPIEVTRQDRIYCLKVSSDYHSEVCEECKFYPNCDHMTQDDMTELTIKDLEALEQEPTTKNDLGVDCISRQAVIDLMMQKWGENFSGDDAMQESIDAIRVMPSVTPQEPKTGHCRDCKWWKDSDGAFRRGIEAESQCPMNRIEVYEGNGYCYMFEPQERSEV